MKELKKPIIICREYDKYTGKPPIVYKVECDIMTVNLQVLRLRSQFNPELSYFVVLEEDWLENQDFITNRVFREHEFEAFDDFIGRSTLESNGIIRI